MTIQPTTKQALRGEIAVLRARLEEAHETLRAIRSGAVDAVMIGGPQGDTDTQKESVSAVTDLSSFVATTQALRESEDKFKYLFDHSPIGKSITDAVTGGLQVNQAFCSLLGYGVEELRQRRWQDITHPEDIALTQAAIDPLLSGESQTARFTKRYLHQSGAVVWVDVSTALRRDDAGKPLYFITAVIDVSERMQTERREHEFILRLERAMLGTVAAVSRMMDLRDPYTAGHERRVGELSAAIAAAMGLDASLQSGLRVAGNLHDVGKMIVPVELLCKPGKLSVLDREMIKVHAEQGYVVLQGIDFPWPVAEVARQHHERINGSGYPRGLKGEAILLEARILAVADVVEAMSSHRPYRPALGVQAALAEIEQGAGTLYDATAVAACLRLFRDKGYVIPA